uniref:Interferon-induced GTP-binding protein Mx1 n=1 Tax=Felis catus TaxID=9685 RepID=A0ABI7XYM1_FELCA
MVNSKGKITDSDPVSDHLLLNGLADKAEKNQETGLKKNLCSQYEEKVRPCIDLIDSLRALGVEQDLALPAIAVIGDQSSGKSSVLEALSGVALPRGSGIVTRCPLVLKLKKLMNEDEWRGKVSYQDFETEISDPSEVEEAINTAQNAIAGEGLGISHELINLEVSSPHVPDLTLIDLPGITRVAVGNQPADIGRQTKQLIRKYIVKQETINLVVVPCNVDIATTEALSMAQEVDPDGDRTIGILTKPDLVDRGTEDKVVDVAQNLVCHLKKGYMVVKCRGQQDIQDQLSLAEALEKERVFFEDHPHFRVLLEEGRATVPCLADRLTTELIMHICIVEGALPGVAWTGCRNRAEWPPWCVPETVPPPPRSGNVGRPGWSQCPLMCLPLHLRSRASQEKSLPLLENQIKENHEKITEELQKYGSDVPEDEHEKMFFLIDKINAFNHDITSLIQGEESVGEGESRLFTKIRHEFHKWSTVIEKKFQKGYKAIYKEIEKFENRYRGRELPGFVNYKTFEIIIKQQIRELEEPAVDMLRTVTDMVQLAFANISKGNFDEFFNLYRTTKSKIEDIKFELENEAEKSIRLHFQMEQIVYCQDQIYQRALQRVRERVSEEEKRNKKINSPISEEVSSGSVSLCEIFEHLLAYRQEAANRISSHIPLIIQYFILQVYGQRLQKNMLQLLQDKETYSWLLKERSDTSDKRKFLKERLARLAQARRRLAKFPGHHRS